MKKIVVFKNSDGINCGDYVWLKQWCFLYGIPLMIHQWHEPSFDEMRHLLDRESECVVILNQSNLETILSVATKRKWWSGWQKHQFHSYSDATDTQFSWIGLNSTNQQDTALRVNQYLKDLKLIIPFWVPWHRSNIGNTTTQPIINTGLAIGAELYDTPPHIAEHPKSRTRVDRDFLFLVRRKVEDSVMGIVGMRNHFVDEILDKFRDRCLTTESSSQGGFQNDFEGIWSDRVVKSGMVAPDREYDAGPRYLGTYSMRPDLYGRTHFEVVCEVLPNTGHQGRLYAISEKMWKPLMMGHPWVVFHQPGFLRYLRRLGFHTFHDHCDERYDLEQDPVKRTTMICDSVSSLMERGSSEFARLTKHICRHNQHRYLVLRGNNERHLFRQFERHIRPQLG